MSFFCQGLNANVIDRLTTLDHALQFNPLMVRCSVDFIDFLAGLIDGLITEIFQVFGHGLLYGLLFTVVHV